MTFGHPTGQLIQCGARVRQPDSEFHFLVSYRLEKNVKVLDKAVACLNGGKLDNWLCDCFYS